jgi:hypothetical protein
MFINLADYVPGEKDPQYSSADIAGFWYQQHWYF